MTTDRRARRRLQYAFLIGGAFVLSAVDLSMFYAEETLARRDFSTIPEHNQRAGYCMAVTATAAQKRLIADVATPPPDEQLFATIMPFALVGEVTEDKASAMQALKQRVDRRGRANEHAVRLAVVCQYDKGEWRLGETPLTVVQNWLKSDAQYMDFLRVAHRSAPDAARVLYARLQNP
jgi:hypothetical protein